MGKRKSTKYSGVQARESESRRYRGRPDICYTIDYRDETGKRVRKDVGWASEGMSAALASEMRAALIHKSRTSQAMGSSPFKPERSLTFGEGWEKYKNDWLIPRGKHVNKAYGHLISFHLTPILDIPLGQITAYKIDNLMNQMKTKGLALQTIRHAVSLIRAVMKRMAKWGLYDGPMPFDAITLPKLNNARERFLSPDEARNLLEEIKRRSLQTWLMSLISLHCGLRFGEIARLRWGNILYEEMTIYVAESKNGRARHAVMTREVADALAALPAGAQNDLIFPDKNGGVLTAISKSFFRAIDALGLNDIESPAQGVETTNSAKIRDRRQRVVFHTLRHTYASWLAKSGQNQFIIADRLGHHSLQMTMRYTHLMDESRKASADAISKTFRGDFPRNQ